MQSCNENTSKNAPLVRYNGKIENIFFHSLIAYPEKAFDGDKHTEFFDNWYITVNEFNKILVQLYTNNLVLIDPSLCYTVTNINGQRIIKQKPLYLPKGKRPLIISLDDLNYYPFTQKNGLVHKLILDNNGNIVTLTIKENREVFIAKNNALVPIVEAFVKKHPDFSFKGGRGVIALTGYNGILGYPTHKLKAADYKKQKSLATSIANKIKSLGWSFASHSWGHIHFNKANLNWFKHDANRWEKEVRPIIGKTRLFIFPFGIEVQRRGPRFRHLLKYFDVFFGIDKVSGTNFHNNYLYFSRIPFDGRFLKGITGDPSGLVQINGLLDPMRNIKMHLTMQKYQRNGKPGR